MATEELALLGTMAGRFLDRHATAADVERWRINGSVDRDLWNKAGEAGLLGISVPEEYGGGGGDFRHEIVLMEQLGLRGVQGFALPLHNAVVAPYLVSYGLEAQKRKWLPKVVTGETVLAVAMSEPAAGSDLAGMRTTARRDSDHYVINGQKTFITNGLHATLVIVAAKTGQEGGAKGISLFVVETEEVVGFDRGRLLHKLGQEGRDTTELFFHDMRVPAENLLGGVEGRGFQQLMEKLPQERMVIAWQSMAAIERALGTTIDYVKERKAFSKRIIDFQNTQFKLAECKTQATIAKVFLHYCTERLLQRSLDNATASMAKYWLSEICCQIVDECLQLHGGYGYMLEYPIAQMFKDTRVNRIYGGTNEIMKLLIARSL
ncbi:acyl-CoA dehydrogenase family protein [Cupriavidus necator]|uniref:acyl-CoA dehydrogenase family protein n=1 Tax=Cupriavidus necator TaxID=106590 RepID=UPI003ECFE6A2